MPKIIAESVRLHVIELLREGVSKRKIARDLNIARYTVNHIEQGKDVVAERVSTRTISPLVIQSSLLVQMVMELSTVASVLVVLLLLVETLTSNPKGSACQDEQDALLLSDASFPWCICRNLLAKQLRCLS